MPNSTLLASVNLVDRSQLNIRIIYPSGRPPLIEIEWPHQPTSHQLAVMTPSSPR
jgi:hypothetical protein